MRGASLSTHHEERNAHASVRSRRTRALALTSAALSPSSDIAVRRRLEAHTVGDGNMRGGEDLFFFSYNFEDRVRLAPE